MFDLHVIVSFRVSTQHCFIVCLGFKLALCLLVNWSSLKQWCFRIQEPWAQTQSNGSEYYHSFCCFASVFCLFTIITLGPNYKVLEFKGVFTQGKSHSSLALVRTKGKKWYIVAIFCHFGSFSHHTVCSGPNQLKRIKMQSIDNIRFTCWLDVSLNAFPKLLSIGQKERAGRSHRCSRNTDRVKCSRRHTAIIER